MRALFPDYVSQEEIIKQGAFYTPQYIIKLVYSLVNSYLGGSRQKIIVFDSSAGHGAFLRESVQMGFECRAAEFDKGSLYFLNQVIEKGNIFITNSLINVSRGKFNIPEDAFLIIIGNPPYNDVTSEYKKGEKGRFEADIDVIDRDLGIAFLKSFAKLKADIVCVLHPLSYLIKETNFGRLKQFKKNYKIMDGVLFSSSAFYATSKSTPFPIVAALYEKLSTGMTFDYIKRFPFRILDDNKTFILEQFKTTDGYINKYPPRKNEPKSSDIGLYYHSFRDINSLIRNASFMNKPGNNGIVVTVENFYKYAYLFAFKSFFRPKNIWIYGNLSPLIDVDYLEKNKIDFIKYAISKNNIFKEIQNDFFVKILNHYGIQEKDISKMDIPEIRFKINGYISSLAKL